MRGNADGVGDEKAEEDGPEDVLDLRGGDVVRGAEVVEELLEAFAEEADGEEQRRCREASVSRCRGRGGLGAGGLRRCGMVWADTRTE